MVLMATRRVPPPRSPWPADDVCPDADEDFDDDDPMEDGVDHETRIEELEALLKKTQKAVLRARKGFKRKSKAQPPAADAEDGEEVDPARLAKAAKAANARRLRLSVKTICDELDGREDITAEVLNVVIIKCSKPVRAALRLLGAMQQERFLGVKHAIDQLKQRCLNVANSLDLRSNEALPYSTMRRVSERLSTELIDGELCRVILMTAPSHQGEHNPLTRRSNREQGIWDGMSVRAPHVFQGDKSISAALSTLCEDHELQLSVPSQDGIDWAGWYLIDIARDVIAQAAGDDNLRPVKVGLSRRLQMIFDAHGWTSASGATRFMLRCPDTKEQHNSTRYARDVSFYVGRDKHSELEKAVHLGGVRGMWHTLLGGCRISQTPAVNLPSAAALEATRDVAHDAEGFGDRMRKLLGIRWNPCPTPTCLRLGESVAIDI